MVISSAPTLKISKEDGEGSLTGGWRVRGPRSPLKVTLRIYHRMAGPGSSKFSRCGTNSQANQIVEHEIMASGKIKN
jgi:hypothetical protein